MRRPDLRVRAPYRSDLLKGARFGGRPFWKAAYQKSEGSWLVEVRHARIPYHSELVQADVRAYWLRLFSPRMSPVPLCCEGFLAHRMSALGQKQTSPSSFVMSA